MSDVPPCLTCGANDVRPGLCQWWCQYVAAWCPYVHGRAGGIASGAARREAGVK